jgi:alpha-beta hydrolase superfamily lysophospholipase
MTTKTDNNLEQGAAWLVWQMVSIVTAKTLEHPNAAAQAPRALLAASDDDLTEAAREAFGIAHSRFEASLAVYEAIKSANPAQAVPPPISAEDKAGSRASESLLREPAEVISTQLRRALTQHTLSTALN